MKKVTVIGLGYIGLPTAIVLAESGMDVLGFDIDVEKVKNINLGEPSIYEPGVKERLKKILGVCFRAYNTIQVSDYYLIAVPTPINADKTADLSYVWSAAESVASVLKIGDTVILESTVPVGTTIKLAQYLQEQTGMSYETDFYIGFSPERVLPGNIFYELTYNSRVVGGINQDSSDKLKYFYLTFVKSEITVTDSKTAEMTKLVENSCRDVEIAFAHQVSSMAHEAGIDPYQLIDIANKHPRVKILNPRCGVGGHCLAVDPWFLVESFPNSTELLRCARIVNDNRPHQVLKIIENNVKNGDKIAVLGLTYKPDVDDLRESPALEIALELSKKYEITVSDPYVFASDIPAELNKKFLDYDSAIVNADVVVFLVAHRQFLNINSLLLLNKKTLNFSGKDLQHLGVYLDANIVKQLER